MKDDLYISELSGPQFQLALELLREGRPFIYSGITFCFTDDDDLECGVQYTESLSDEGARKDLDRGRTLVNQMLNEVPAFAELIGERKIRFCLIEDYSTSSITLCRLDGDDIRWSAGIRPE